MLTRTLRVFANPYAAIDHMGRCAGACTEAPDWRNSNDTHARYIGATRAVKVLRREEKSARRRVSEIADHTWSFSTEPVLVDASDATDYRHYAQALRLGEILPADKETADLVGVPFRDPAEKLSELRAHNGGLTPSPKPAWEAFLAAGDRARAKGASTPQPEPRADDVAAHEEH